VKPINSIPKPQTPTLVRTRTRTREGSIEYRDGAVERAYETIRPRRAARRAL